MAETATQAADRSTSQANRSAVEADLADRAKENARAHAGVAREQSAAAGSFATRAESAYSETKQLLDRAVENPGGPVTPALAAPALEGAALFAFGNSYVFGDQEVAGSKFVDRVHSRLKTRSLANYGRNGWSSAGIANTVLQTWNVGTRGLVILNIIVNDAQYFGARENVVAYTQRNTRTILDILCAGASLSETSAQLSYGGSGWAPVSDAVYRGGTAMRTATVGDFVDVVVAGSSAQLLTRAVASTTGGTVTAISSVDGALLKTWDLGNAIEAAPMSLRVDGLANGSTVRYTLTAGDGFAVDQLLQRNPNPPTIVLLREGPVTGWFAGPFVGDVEGGNAALRTLSTALEQLSPEYPTLLLTSQAGPRGWDRNTMLVPPIGSALGGLHPNPKGSAAIAEEILLTLGAPAFREGLNELAAPFVAVAGVPSFVPAGGATAPARVFGLTLTASGSSITASWTAPSTNGSAITDYLVEYRLSSASSWTTWTHTASTATTAQITVDTTGTYEVRVSAKNAIGTGAASAVASKAVTIVTVYSRDTFNRADTTPLAVPVSAPSTLGSTEVGSYAWSSRSTVGSGATIAIASGAMQAARPGGSDLIATMDDGQANGLWSWIAPTTGSPDVGYVIRDNGTSFIMGWGGGGLGTSVYRLMFWTGSAYQQLAIATSKTVGLGDEVKIRAVGNDISLIVNGETVCSVTTTSNSAATRSGMRFATHATNTALQVARHDFFEHTSA